MADGFDAKVQGIPDLTEALNGIVPKLRVRALRNALTAGARLVQRAARAATPVLSPLSLAVRKGYRKSGTVRKAISVRTSKAARRSGDVGVFVNVRPARGAQFRTTTYKLGGLVTRTRRQVAATQRGSNADPFYWRFINFGTAKGVQAFGFLEKGAEQLPAALRVFLDKIGPAIQKLNKPKAPAP